MGGKIGFINSEGEYTVQPSIPMNPDLRYYRDWIFEYDGHLVFPDEKERLFGLLNKKGEWIVEPQYEEIGDLTYGFRTFGDSYNEHRLGPMDSDGKIVLEQRYTRIDIDADYIEVRDADFNISYFKHDNEKILSHVLEKKETKGKIQDYINSNSPSKK